MRFSVDRIGGRFFCIKNGFAEGFVVIMPSFRAMGCNEIETAISEELFLSGFTLQGLRIYETHLIIKYLKYKNFIDKIGIMGYSGGSDVAYLASIIALIYRHWSMIGCG